MERREFVEWLKQLDEILETPHDLTRRRLEESLRRPDSPDAAGSDPVAAYVEGLFAGLNERWH